ncbi:transposase [Escherichia coli]|nr:transposase [Escherichia coli]
MLLPLRTTPSVAEQEGQLIETEATGAPQKHLSAPMI